MLTEKIAGDETKGAEALGKESDMIWPWESTVFIKYLCFIWDKDRRLKILHHLGRLQSVNCYCVTRGQQTQKREKESAG